MNRKIPVIKKISKEETKKEKNYSFLAILFSVFVALVLWFYVQEAEAPDYKKTFNSVSVEMQSLSSSFSVIDGGENTVDITLIGKRSDLNKIKASDLEAYLDLSHINQAGTYQAEVSVLVPEGTELFECFPLNAILFVDQTVSVSVPVKVELGNFTGGENIGVEAQSAVSSVNVKGPKTILDQIDHAKVCTGDLGEVTGSFENNLNYELYDANQNVIDSRHVILPEKNVKVQFSVYKTKTVPLTVQSKNGWWTSANMTYSVSPESIIIKGEPALVDAVESVPAITVDEHTVDSTRFTATLAPSQLELPEGIRLGETLGDVSVNLSLSDNAQKTLKMNLDSNHVVVTPPNGDLQYRFNKTTLSFKVRGSLATINEATLNDFYLNIDLSEVQTKGEMEVPVQIVQTSASEGKYYTVGSYTVSITVS